MLVYQPLDDAVYQQILPLIEQAGAYDEFDLKKAKEQQAETLLYRDHEQLIGCVIYRKGKRIDFDEKNQTGLADKTKVIYIDLLQVDDNYRFCGYGKILWNTLRNQYESLPIVLISTVFSTDFWHRFAERKQNNWFCSLPK